MENKSRGIFYYKLIFLVFILLTPLVSYIFLRCEASLGFLRSFSFFLIDENSCLKSRGYFLFLLGFFDSYTFWNKEKQTFGTFIYRFLFSIYQQS